MEATDVIKNLITVWSTIMASFSYCYYVSARIPKGFPRLISLSPILMFFCILPLYINSVIATFITSLFITWLANFKLLRFAFEKGPLGLPKPDSLLAFVSMAALPIKVKQQGFKNNAGAAAAGTNRVSSVGLVSKIFAFVVSVRVVILYKKELHLPVPTVLCWAILFLSVEILVTSFGYVLKALTGLELEQPSNRPYLSTSLQDFWGKRWNLMMTNAIRHAVVTPVRSTCGLFMSKEASLFTAMMTGFAVSGLLHELMWYYFTRVSPSWESTLFFMLHGACVIVEFVVKKACEGRLSLPRLVSRALTLGFVVVTSSWLLFPPLIRNGLDDKLLEEAMRCVLYLKVACNYLIRVVAMQSRDGIEVAP